MPRKPRGVNGPARITSGAESVEFMSNTLPSEKAGIESFIVEGARITQRALQINPWNVDGEPEQLDENSLDFRLPTKDGAQYLDLVEFAPLGKYKGSYERVPNKHNAGEFADALWSLVKKKSAHYGLSRRGKEHLLVYITDFRFFPSESVFSLFVAYCKRKIHGFATVAFYTPIDMESGMFRQIYPSVEGVLDLSNYDERLLRAREFTNMDMRKMRMSEDRRSAFFEPQI
ncbi:MAG: hypothetical protein ACREMS_00980 [Gemmatimonadaceae bacterium]